MPVMPDSDAALVMIEAERRNDIDICMTQFLDAASDIHTAMCRLDGDHGCQAVLSSALHAVLIGAQQCRQAMAANTTKRIVDALRGNDAAKAA